VVYPPPLPSACESAAAACGGLMRAACSGPGPWAAWRCVLVPGPAGAGAGAGAEMELATQEIDD
jgi:hypothetical protein